MTEPAVEPAVREPEPVVLGFDPGVHDTGSVAMDPLSKKPRLVQRRTLPFMTPKKGDEIKAIVEDAWKYYLRHHGTVWTIQAVFIEDQRQVQHGKRERGESNYGAERVRDVQFALAGAAMALGIPVIFVPIATAKKAMTGNGRASKKQMALVAEQLFRSTMQEDQADAAAAAIAGMRMLHAADVVRRQIEKRAEARA